MGRTVFLLAAIATVVLLAAAVALRPAAVGDTVVGDPVLVGAGDIATCGGSGDEATANLLDGIEGTVFTLGDNAYTSGTPTQFANCYDPTWGRHKARTKPSAGNHEYLTADASGYFGYFGAAAGEPGKGYYSYDLGDWHIIVLNSNCSKVGGCQSGSLQGQWLRADLATHPNTCTLAYFHFPLYSSGEHGSMTNVRPFWEALYEENADVVLSAHDHNYERFAPQDPYGVADSPRGIREFVVGTGGGALRPFGTVKANSEARDSATQGVLKLMLHPSSYDWQFVPVEGNTFADSGSGQCHGTPGGVDTTAPRVMSISPANNATGVAPGADVTATFSEAMDPNSISGTTFKLVRLNADGTTTKVTATVTYDAATKKATLDPTNDLSSGATYKATVTTDAKDSAGNTLDQNSTTAGNQVKSWKFTVG
jgi:hypothetical protein